MAFVRRLLDALNIRVQANQGWLVASSVASGLLYALSCVPIQKEICTNLPAQYLSAEAIWICLSSVVVGWMWKGKVRLCMLGNFAAIALAESVLSFLLSLYLVFISYNVWVFAIASVFYSSLICFFVGKCKMMFEANLWKSREREQYDNTTSIVRNLTAVCGFGLATAFMPTLSHAVLFWGLGCIFDDIGWVIVYVRCRDALLAGKGCEPE